LGYIKEFYLQIAENPFKCAKNIVPYKKENFNLGASKARGLPQH
jgi:hypothetical protein